MTRTRGSVAILGGGMGALATAFELSEGDWTKRFERITVYQRGWRLGGKGASSRGPNGRVEEHGLHVLLGYYDHTFDVMQRCYDELDRGRSDPSCPCAPGTTRSPPRTWSAWWTGTTARGNRGWRRSARAAGAPVRAVVGPPDRRRWTWPSSWSGPSASSSTSSRRSRSPHPRRRLHPPQHLADRATRPRRGAGRSPGGRRAGCGPDRPDAPAQLGRAGRGPGDVEERQP